jgi:hypothetical protein
MLRPVRDARTELSLICRCEAHQQFLSNVPEVLSNLVGHQNAQRGAMKVFETLQDPKLNKQLFYVSSTSPFPSHGVNGDSLEVCVRVAEFIFMQKFAAYTASENSIMCL